jgi:type I restriction enzyme M protein
MVRLSLVNLYLHGFTDPHIYEYDTLTQEDRWNELADVILANPPFMSPKGGIKPHKRFSIEAKRSEVLFVDYMAEHLTANGRAGIIVPEGIIFQSQTAYKALRKMLVDEALVAVVSLPAGCFNPYSGVKTSILILDKSIARQSDTIAFFKVENDGFGLGAQRRAIEKNDLPQVKAEIEAYLQALRDGDPVDAMTLTAGHVVAKAKIAESAEYNLSGDRYRVGSVATSSYPFVQISEFARVKNGFAFKSDEYVSEGLRVMRIKNVQKGEVIDDDPKFMAPERQEEFADYALKAGDILMSLTGNVGRVGRLKNEHEPALLNQRVAHVEPIVGAPCLPEYLFALLNTDKFESDAIAGSSGVAQANLSSKWVGDYQIPLPPLDVQKEIVAEIESCQKVIDGARAVLEYYRPHIQIDPDWPVVTLGDVCDLYQPKTITQQELIEDGPYLVFGANGVIGRYDQYNHEEAEVLITCRGATCGTINKSAPRSWVTGNAMVAKPKDERLSKNFLFSLLQGSDLGSTISGSAQPQITRQGLAPFEIPLPPLVEQEAIVSEIEAEQILVSANRELVVRFEKKIQATLLRVWGEVKVESPED